MGAKMGRIRAFLPSTVPTLLFLGATLLQGVVDVSIVGILLHSFEDGFIKTVLARNEASVLPVYLGLFILAHVFQIVLALDALAAKNTLQILGLCIFNTLFLTYAIIQIIEIRSLISGHVLRVLVYFMPGMIAVTELVYLATLLPIYKEFGWNIYKRIGADRTMKRLFMWYQVFLCILKFDVFFFVAFSLQLVLLVLQQNALERWLTVAALPITLILLIFGFLSVRHEIRSLFFVFLLGCIVGAGYFIFKLFRIYKFRLTDYILVYKSLTVFAALCLSALAWITTTSLICYRNFGRGLKQQMEKARGASLDKLGDEVYMLESGNASRMTMD